MPPQTLGLSDLAFLAQGQAVPGAVGGWVELDRTTLGSPGEEITVTGLADKRYYMTLYDGQQNADLSVFLRAGNGSVDIGTNYANRISSNGGTDSTFINRANIVQGTSGGGAFDEFGVGYWANLSGKEKLQQSHTVGPSNAGAGSAPFRAECVGKWVNTANPLDTISYGEFSSGSFATGSELVVLGWDPTDTHTNNFWEEIFSQQLISDNQNFSTGTISARKYLWLQFYQVGMTGNAAWRFNGDSTTSYSRRHEINGAADAIVTLQTSLLNVLTGGTGDRQSFTNAFIINNSASEKLLIFNTVFGPTGAGTTPQKILGVCKWDEVAAQITSMTVDDSGAGFDTGSFLKIWGAN